MKLFFRGKKMSLMPIDRSLYDYPVYSFFFFFSLIFVFFSQLLFSLSFCPSRGLSFLHLLGC